MGAEGGGEVVGMWRGRRGGGRRRCGVGSGGDGGWRVGVAEVGEDLGELCDAVGE